MKADRDITATELRARLQYDPTTGVFTWPDGRVAGNPAGRYGRLQITLGGVARYASRLAWLYVHGEWPTGQVDHINGDRCDNRIGNLRVLSNAENKQNQSAAYANNKSAGVLGVSRASNGRWRARIMVDGRSRSLGTFATRDEAADAYVAAKQELHPAWAQPSRAA